MGPSGSLAFHYFVRRGVHNITVCPSVCLSVCLSVVYACTSASLQTHLKHQISNVKFSDGACCLWLWHGPPGSVTLSTSAFADDVIFPHNGSRGNVDLRVVLQQGVATFQRIRQGSPHCLTLSSYTITSNCAPGGKVCCSRLPSNTVERRDGRVGLAIKDVAGIDYRSGCSLRLWNHCWHTYASVRPIKQKR